MTSKRQLIPTRNVLIAVAGQTPAIVTETLWALEQRCGELVDEIRIITTAPGAEAVTRELLGPDGAFARYCSDYGVPAGRIAFSPSHLYVLKDADGAALQDIRNTEDNRITANTIFSLVREWCSRPDEILHCSIAGGRKTMGNYLTMSLMLCGRSQDRLSHVLVAPEFERGVRDFYYPPPRETFYRPNRSADGPFAASLSSADAAVELADIPFPRLRELLGGELPLEKGLIEAIAHSQNILQYLQRSPTLSVRFDLCRVSLGAFDISLPKQLMAVYVFFLLKFNGSRSRGTMEDLFRERLLLARLERLMDRMKQAEHESYAWEAMREVDDFRSRLSPCISKINRAFRGVLGKNRLAKSFSISTGGVYGVDVKDFHIFVKEGEQLTDLDFQRLRG